MMDEKELTLAVSFNSAPKEVQYAAKTHHDNIKNVNMLKVKLAETAKALEDAELSMASSEAVFVESMISWNMEA